MIQIQTMAYITLLALGGGGFAVNFDALDMKVNCHSYTIMLLPLE